jgi:hypothetical protein
MRETTSHDTALAASQPIGRIIRRRQLAILANHSLKWVDLEASRQGTVLVKVRNANGHAIGFTEESVRELLGCSLNKEV